MSRCELFVRDLSFWVRLGCGEAERALPQEVRLSLSLKFAETPGACFSDDIRETVCYAELSGALKSYCESREFKTVEKLGQGLLEQTEKAIGTGHEVQIDVHKVRPPVPGLNGGVVFRIANRGR